jgi:lambda family phage minor tail protein L
MAGGTGNLGGFESDYGAPGYGLAGYNTDSPLDGTARELSGDAIIVLFVLDATNYDGGQIYRFTPMTNELKAPIIWQGETYTPFPCEADGFEFAGDGSIPRPKFAFSNIQGLLSPVMEAMDDFQGSKVTRKRTEARYLDAANFALGNPNANPDAAWPDDVYYVERKTRETRDVIELELSAGGDFQGAQIPKRVCAANTCPWAYKSAECTYVGGLPTCDKTLTDCKTHFGANNPLPFGGFPGVGRFRR